MLSTSYKQKILFVCARNKIRSLTAERLFLGSMHYAVRSRGVADDARVKLSERDLHWADLVFVMEKNHKNRLSRTFPEALREKRVVCLFIDDIYEPMEDALISELRSKLTPYLHVPEN